MTLHHTIGDWLWFGFFVTLCFDMAMGLGIELPLGFLLIDADYDGRNGDARLLGFDVRRLMSAERMLMVAVTTLYGIVLAVAGFAALIIHAPLVFPIALGVVALAAGLLYGAYRFAWADIPDGDLRMFYFTGGRESADD